MQARGRVCICVVAFWSAAMKGLFACFVGLQKRSGDDGSTRVIVPASEKKRSRPPSSPPIGFLLPSLIVVGSARHQIARAIGNRCRFPAVRTIRLICFGLPDSGKASHGHGFTTRQHHSRLIRVAYKYGLSDVPLRYLNSAGNITQDKRKQVLITMALGKSAHPKHVGKKPRKASHKWLMEQKGILKQLNKKVEKAREQAKLMKELLEKDRAKVEEEEHEFARRIKWNDLASKANACIERWIEITLEITGP